MSTPEPVGPPAQTAAMTTLTAEVGTNPYPVDSATRTCCGGIGTHTRDCLTVAPPAGADLVGRWEDTIDCQQPHRSVFGRDRLVTDSEVRVYPFAIQLADGSTDLFADPGGVNVAYGESIGLGQLNSDQARELAAALLECAAELDGWVAG